MLADQSVMKIKRVLGEEKDEDCFCHRCCERVLMRQREESAVEEISALFQHSGMQRRQSI